MKKLLIIFVILVILIIFFFPKVYIKGECGGMKEYEPKEFIHYKEVISQKCFGIKFKVSSGFECGLTTLCSGIIYNKEKQCFVEEYSNITGELISRGETNCR